MLDGKRRLLEQLRVDRGPVSEGVTSRLPRYALPLAVSLLVVLVVVGMWLRERSASKTTPADESVQQLVVDQQSSPGKESVSTLDASGYVIARRAATVASKVLGRVKEIEIEEGQRVRRGEVIARLDDSNARAALDLARSQLMQAEAKLRSARIALEDVEPMFRRNEMQRAAGVISAQDFDAAKGGYNAAKSEYLVQSRAVEVAHAAVVVAERSLEDTIIRAPFDGVVTVKAAQAGEIVSPQSAGGGFTRTGIGTIVDMDSLEVEVDVSEKFIARVNPNQTVRIRVNALPDIEMPGKVIAVVPTADRTKGAVKVRIGFDERDPRVLPEMGATVSFFTAPTSPNATMGESP